MDQLTGLCSDKYFVSSCLKEWEKFGRKNFLTRCREAGLTHSLSLLMDLFVKLLNGDGKIDILSKLLPEMKKLLDDPLFESKLLDVLWLIDTSMSDIQSEPIRDRYFRLLHLCKTCLNSALLMERLSEDTLESMSLIHSRQQFETRYVRTKTRLFFKQQKFNLLREENEGYAKLITELTQTTGSMDAMMTQVQSLIGFFDLDPNRVLDLILDACEFRESMSHNFLKLIRLHNPDKHDLTHILGHKFHFTQDPDVVTPPSLYRIAALLISDGLVYVDVLYNHLYPSEADIYGTRSRMLSSAKAYRPSASLVSAFGFNNNFVNSDASGNNLSNSNHPPGLTQDSAGQGSGFLSNGWTSNRNMEDNARADEIHKVQVHETVEESESDFIADALYENNQKLELCAALLKLGDWINAQSILDRYSGYWATGHPRLCNVLCELLHYLIEPLYSKVCPLPSYLLRHRSTPLEFFIVPTDHSLSEHQFRITPVDDFMKLARVVLPIAMYLGPNMSSDTVLMVKFARLGSAYMVEHGAHGTAVDLVYQGFFNLVDEVLLPSLGLVDANCCLCEEIWQLLRFMPYDHRYRLYGQWIHTSGQDDPRTIRKKALLLVRLKAIMKRLSKENVKPMGRQLGKLLHSNAGFLFENILHVLQLYTNLVTPVVDALKYVSSLGYDVLTFCIIEALASDEVKLEDLQLSQSLQALSLFTGLLCKKYQFDLSGLLQYVLNQLKVGKSYDLQILREILHRMSGIDTYEDMTDEQLESMSGGELLLQEGGYYAQIRNTRKNATRLKEALIQHDMIMPFIFLMAQQRDALLFLDEPERHVKLAGRLYDQCQGTLVQFITFLSLQLTREEMQSQCLPIERIMSEFHVQADVAFCLHRSLFEQKVARLSEAKERSDFAIVDEFERTPSKALFASVSQQVCAEIGFAIRPLYPPRVWDELGTNFFVTFWSLQSSDLVIPEGAYQRQIQQLRDQLQQIEIATTGWTVAKKKRETERLQSLIEKLTLEQTERHEHVARVRAWLLVERDSWFPTRLVNKTDTITQFLQLCIYPRVCFTAADAVYPAQFIHVLHQLKTPRFSTLICLDRIFNDITLPISMFTEDEAHRYGRFLCAVLELIMRWHSNEEMFNQECGQYPGFVTVFRKPGSPKCSDATTKADQLQFENYRHVVHKWHYRITKATVACLESGSYVQIRNALIVLTRILPQYPRILQFGSAVERRVHKVREEEKDRRPDLKALAFSYSGLLIPRKSTWVNEEEFHCKENKPTPSDVISNHGSSGTGRTTDRGQQLTRTTINHVASSGGLNENQPTGSLDSTHGSSTARRPIGSSGSLISSKSLSHNDSRPRSHVTSSASTSGVSVTVTETCAGLRVPHGSTSQGSFINGPVHSQSPVHRQRSVLKTEPSHSSDYAGSVNDDIQGSKRRRVEPNPNQAGPGNVMSPTSGNSSSTPSAQKDDGSSALCEERRSERKISRKRVVPATLPTNNLTDSAAESVDCPVRSGSGNRTGGIPMEHQSASNQCRHHCNHQRASSTNSVDSREDEEKVLASNGKKSRRVHHHHHRRSTESSEPNPGTAQYSSSLNVLGDASTSGSSRHCRK